MSEEEKAIKWLENNTKNYKLKSEELHYILVLFNLIANLQEKNQKYKEVINKAIKYIEENKQHEYRNGNLDEYYLELNEKEMTELLDILKEVEDK